MNKSFFLPLSFFFSSIYLFQKDLIEFLVSGVFLGLVSYIFKQSVLILNLTAVIFSFGIFFITTKFKSVWLLFQILVVNRFKTLINLGQSYGFFLFNEVIKSISILIHSLNFVRFLFSQKVLIIINL